MLTSRLMVFPSEFYPGKQKYFIASGSQHSDVVYLLASTLSSLLRTHSCLHTGDSTALITVIFKFPGSFSQKTIQYLIYGFCLLLILDTIHVPTGSHGHVRS